MGEEFVAEAPRSSSSQLDLMAIAGWSGNLFLTDRHLLLHFHKRQQVLLLLLLVVVVVFVVVVVVVVAGSAVANVCSVVRIYCYGCFPLFAWSTWLDRYHRLSCCTIAIRLAKYSPYSAMTLPFSRICVPFFVLRIVHRIH